MNSEQLINNILRLGGNAGELINNVADSYRNGENLSQLIPLLEHCDPSVVSAAVWIVKETVEGTRGRELFNYIVDLLHYSDNGVRFTAIEIVAKLVHPDDVVVILQLFSLLDDPILGVRLQALFWVCQLSDSIIMSLRQTELWHLARLLIDDADKVEIRNALTAPDMLAQRIGVAAAIRKSYTDEEFLNDCNPSFDDEVMDSLPRFGWEF